MLVSQEVISSIRKNESFLSAIKKGHFARGDTGHLGGSAGQIYRAELVCSYCGGHLNLKKDPSQRSQLGWLLDGDSQTVLSESCDARHQAIEEWYRRIFRNLDEAQREQLARRNRRAAN
jgi:hypothetical protein